MDFRPLRALLPGLAIAAAFGVARAEEPQSQPPANAADSAPPDDKDPIVCRTFPPPLGSRIGERKICHKLSEWNRMQQQTQDSLRQVEKAGDLTRAPPQ